MSFEKAKYPRAALPEAPFETSMSEGELARNLRNESITDKTFAEGRVHFSGVSNEEFSSTLRAITFSFSTVDKGTVVEKISLSAREIRDTRASSNVRTL